MEILLILIISFLILYLFAILFIVEFKDKSKSIKEFILRPIGVIIYLIILSLYFYRYIKKIRVLNSLLEKNESLELKIDQQLEELADADYNPDTGVLLQELAENTRGLQALRKNQIEKIVSKTFHLKARLDDLSIKDVIQDRWHRILDYPVVPEKRYWAFSDVMSDKASEEGVSRIELSIASRLPQRAVLLDDFQEGDDWDLDDAYQVLRSHLLLQVPDEFDDNLVLNYSRTLKDPQIAANARDLFKKTDGLFEKADGLFEKAEPSKQLTWTAVSTSSFKKSLRRATQNVQERALEAITELLCSPAEPKGNTVKPLKGNKKGLWSYRIGDFRLIYQPLINERELRLISLKHRSQSY